MIPSKIKYAIENSALTDMVDRQRYGTDWTKYTRTVFDQFARKINAKVTRQVIDHPYLVSHLLLVGKEEMENVLFKHRLNSMDDFITHLKGLNDYNPHHWISGKTLYLYWQNGNAKDKKLNVLLTFLEIEMGRWDDWKKSDAPDQASLKSKLKGKEGLLKNHYQGCYFRYYQKTDGSHVLVKAPFQIKEDPNQGIIGITKTVGHYYKSSSVAIRDGALYIECENINWNEKESHVFNVGFETNPQLLIGVSTTLSRRGHALGIKNVLVRQAKPYDYDKTDAEEIPFDTVFEEPCEESQMVDFFKRSAHNLITTSLVHSFHELSGFPEKALK